jgi:hypothetical protein
MILELFCSDEDVTFHGFSIIALDVALVILKSEFHFYVSTVEVDKTK